MEGTSGIVDVVEINPYAPRPYVFSEAALCLRDAIQAAGYRSRLYVNQADRAQFSIVLGALAPHIRRVEQLEPARTIIYNLEQLGSGTALAGPDYEAWLRHWVVADYHSANVEYLRQRSGGQQRAFELPLVPGPSLAFHPELPDNKTVDVLFFGTPSPRRTEVLRQLEAAGLHVEVVAGAFGPELTPALRRARLVLHVHFYGTGLFPVTRVLQPVVAGVPIVCEDSVFSELADWSRSGILFAPYGGLVEACRALLAAPQEQAVRTWNSQAFIRQLDVATPLQRLLAALG
jgi:hypothetical protein